VILRGAEELLLLRGGVEDVDYHGGDGALLVQPRE